jgi:hypothetical protein
MSHLSYGMAGEGDSTASKIQFNTFEAILSSRIIHFKWSVASEEDGHQFIIEKSLDQLDWYTVTKIASIKSHKEQHTYEISEIDFAEGVNEYFRVVRIDAFGEKTELDRVNINRPVLKNMLMIPVPRRVNKEVTISYDSMICSDGTLSVMREDGSIIQENQVGISEGYNRFQLNIKNFEPGNYLVFVKDEFGNKVSKRLVVHK